MKYLLLTILIIFTLFHNVHSSEYISTLNGIEQSVGAVQSQLTSMRNTKATISHKSSAWAKAYGGFGDQGTSGKSSDVTFSNVGGMLGIDYMFSQSFIVGALVGFTHSNQNYGSNGNYDDNSIRFGGYTSYSYGDFFINVTPTMGIHMMDTNASRTSSDGYILRSKGSRTGIDLNINGSVGYNFELPKSFTLTPMYSLGYTMLYDPSYSENGTITGGAVNNVPFTGNIQSFVTNSLLQDLTLKLKKTIAVNNTLSVEIDGVCGYEVEFLNTGGYRGAELTANNTIYIKGRMDCMPTHRAFWGAGITANINSKIAIFARYDHKIWNTGYNVGFTTGISVIF